MADIDFGAIAAQIQQATSDGTVNTPPSGGTPASAPAAPSAPASAAPAAPAPGQAASGNPNPAEDLIEVQFKDGRVEKIARADLPNAVLMQRDYTKKTQELAEQRKQFEPIAQAYQELTAERQQVAQLFQNPQLLAQFIQKQYGPQFVQALQALNQPDPLAAVNSDDVVTAQQAALIAQRQAEQQANALVEVVQQRLQELEQRFTEKTNVSVQAGMKQLEDSQEIAAQMKVFDAHVANLLNEHPILQAMPEMEDAIRFRVIQREPSSPEEAKKFLTEEVERQAKAFESKFTELQKQAIAGKAKLTSHGIEPPGGQGVQPEPKNYKTPKGETDWKSLAGSATDYLNQFRK